LLYVIIDKHAILYHAKYQAHAKNYENNTPTDMYKDTFIFGAFTNYRYMYNVNSFANYVLTV